MGAYDAKIDNDDTAVGCARTEAAHKAKRADRATYKTAWRETVRRETARQETALFILAVVEDTWVRELRDTETLYTDVTPKGIARSSASRMHGSSWP